MRILVTGATGFVGTALIPALLTKGWHIRAAVRQAESVQPHLQNIEMVAHGDLTNFYDWSRMVEGCDAVVHLAGIAHTDSGIAEELYERVNHAATLNLVRAAETAGVRRFVLASSIRAQCGPSCEFELTEATPAEPVDAYGRSKLAAEHALEQSSLDYTILRPVLIYGPGAKGNLASLTRLAELPLPLPFGGLTARRSFLNIENFISAIVLALQSPQAVRQTFLVADKTPVTVRDVVVALRRGLNKSPRLATVPRPLLHAAFYVAGKRKLLDRLDGDLVVRPEKLIAAGWQPTDDTMQALEKIASSLLSR